MDEKNVKYNKIFWKTSGPLLSDRDVSREKINLTKNEKTFTSESEIAETLNNLFSNIVNKLEIAKFDSKESFTENTKDPVSEVILKWKIHSEILAIQKYSKNKINHLEEVKIGAFEKEILKLDETKDSQNTDLTTTIIKESIDIFAKFLYTRKNSAIRFASFPFFSK